MRLLFRLDASHKIGFGHLRRCLILAAEAKKQGWFSRFIVYGDEAGKLAVEQAGYKIDLFKDVGLSDQMQAFAEYALARNEVAVLDIVNSNTMQNAAEMAEYLSLWKKSVRRVLLIDGGAPQSVRFILNSLPADIVLAPYVGENLGKSFGVRALLGPKFYILPEEYCITPPRKIRENADRILVTCGGSDPKGLTPLVLSALNAIGFPLHIKVVIGPLFAASVVSEINEIIKTSNHHIEGVDKPSLLAELMVWADIAVSTTGLTKYELAATGTPMLGISIDSLHDKINAKFLAAGTSWSLGVFDQLKSNVLSEQVKRLLHKYKTRKRMSENGLKLTDGQGCKRILKELLH